MKEYTKKERLQEKSREHKEYIERVYKDFIYINSEYGVKEKDKYKFFITVECKECGNIKKYSMGLLKQGTKCKCKNQKLINNSIKVYTQDLFRSLKMDENGLLFGEDLKEYIRASALYDKGTLANVKGYQEKVYENILKLYKKEKIFKCNVCENYYVNSRMHITKIGTCRDCARK